MLGHLRSASSSSPLLDLADRSADTPYSIRVLQRIAGSSSRSQRTLDDAAAAVVELASAVCKPLLRFCADSRARGSARARPRCRGQAIGDSISRRPAWSSATIVTAEARLHLDDLSLQCPRSSVTGFARRPTGPPSSPSVLRRLKNSLQAAPWWSRSSRSRAGCAGCTVASRRGGSSAARTARGAMPRSRDRSGAPPSWADVAFTRLRSRLRRAGSPGKVRRRRPPPGAGADSAPAGRGVEVAGVHRGDAGARSPGPASAAGTGSRPGHVPGDRGIPAGQGRRKSQRHVVLIIASCLRERCSGTRFRPDARQASAPGSAGVLTGALVSDQIARVSRGLTRPTSLRIGRCTRRDCDG